MHYLYTILNIMHYNKVDMKRVLSFDIGIKNLAFAVVDHLQEDHMLVLY